MAKRYDRFGQRVTSCCGVYSTYSGSTLCCKKCWREVEVGEGDGSEFAPGVDEKRYYVEASAAERRGEGTL